MNENSVAVSGAKTETNATRKWSPPGPLAGPRQLSAAEVENLVSLTDRVTADPATGPNWVCHQARLATRRLDDALVSDLLAFRDWGSNSGAMVIQGAPVGLLPATPVDNTAGVARLTQLARSALLVASVLGDPLAYQAEGHGHLIQDMVPSRRLAYTQQSQGSRVELELHTEQAFSQHRPDWVVLACLRGDPDAATFLFTVRQLTRQLTGDERIALRQARWTTTIDESFKPFVPRPDEVRGPMPILSGPAWDPTIVFDQDLTRGLDPEAEYLRKKVIELYLEHRTAYVLRPGDILVVDNSRAVHGRSAFSPRFDGADRFIARLMAVRDLATVRDALAPDGRTISAHFS